MRKPPEASRAFFIMLHHLPTQEESENIEEHLFYLKRLKMYQKKKKNSRKGKTS